MTENSFGARLRHERERRGISLASIAANTKIASPLLEALERDDVSRWPGGIYRRSFIRAYAEAIGLDSAEVMREFFERFPDPGDAPAAEPPVTGGSTPETVAAAVPSPAGFLRVSIEKTPPVCRGGCLLPEVWQRLTESESGDLRVRRPPARAGARRTRFRRRLHDGFVHHQSPRQVVSDPTRTAEFAISRRVLVGNCCKPWAREF